MTNWSARGDTAGTKPERVLGLLATYHRQDLLHALERAARYRAFSCSAVERILAAQAHPRSGWESLQAEARESFAEILRQSPVSARSTAEYQPLLEEASTADADEDEDEAENEDQSNQDETGPDDEPPA